MFFVISKYIILRKYIRMSHNYIYLNGPTLTNLNYYRHFYGKTLFFIIKDKKMFFVAGSEPFTCKITRKVEISGRKLKEAYFGYLKTPNPGHSQDLGTFNGILEDKLLEDKLLLTVTQSGALT